MTFWHYILIAIWAVACWADNSRFPELKFRTRGPQNFKLEEAWSFLSSHSISTEYAGSGAISEKVSKIFAVQTVAVWREQIFPLAEALCEFNEASGNVAIISLHVKDSAAHGFGAARPLIHKIANLSKAMEAKTVSVDVLFQNNSDGLFSEFRSSFSENEVQNGFEPDSSITRLTFGGITFFKQRLVLELDRVGSLKRSSDYRFSETPGFSILQSAFASELKSVGVGKLIELSENENWVVASGVVDGRVVAAVALEKMIREGGVPSQYLKVRGIFAAPNKISYVQDLIQFLPETMADDSMRKLPIYAVPESNSPGTPCVQFLIQSGFLPVKGKNRLLILQLD